MAESETGKRNKKRGESLVGFKERKMGRVTTTRKNSDLKFDRSGTYVSIFEYVIGGNKKLAVLTSYPDDKIGDEVLLYINGAYIVRNKISFKGKRLVTVFAAAWAGVIIHDIVIQWSGMLDIMAVTIECCLLVIFVLYSPILYKNHITDIKKHLGWHLNL